LKKIFTLVEEAKKLDEEQIIDRVKFNLNLIIIEFRLDSNLIKIYKKKKIIYKFKFIKLTFFVYFIL
jgi:hypothetical protein